MAGSTMTPTFNVLLCLGLCRGPWDQVQAAVPPKPSIWAEPGTIISKGSPVTIWCQGSLQVDGYLLFKEKGSEALDTSIPQAPSNKTGFLIRSMSLHYTGLYQCAYSTGGRLSERSEPLLLVMTGEHSKPSLSAQPGPSVPWGANVTLQCRSEVRADTFHLHREGSLDPPQQLHLQDTAAPSQANFTISPVTSGHYGTYRCYSSHSSSPFLLSQPSDPLELVVSGVQLSLSILITISVALVLLLSLLLFLLFRHQHQSKLRTSGAALKDPQPGEGMKLDAQQDGTNDNSKGVTYAQVNFRSRLRQGMTSSPSPLSEELLDRKGRQAEEDRQMDNQAAASEDPQDMTYAQLTLMTLRQETSAPPSSPSEQPPDEPSVYAALAVH